MITRGEKARLDLGLLCICLGFLLVTLDATIVNVALETIQDVGEGVGRAPRDEGDPARPDGCVRSPRRRQSSPSRTWKSWSKRSDRPAHSLVTVTPAGHERYFDALVALVAESGPGMPIVALNEEHGTVMVA